MKTAAMLHCAEIGMPVPDLTGLKLEIKIKKKNKKNKGHINEHSAFEVWANAPPSFLLQVLQDDCNHFDE